MTNEEQTVLIIKGFISQLSASEQEACKEVVDHLKRVIKQAGDPVGPLALALVGAEAQL